MAVNTWNHLAHWNYCACSLDCKALYAKMETRGSNILDSTGDRDVLALCPWQAVNCRFWVGFIAKLIHSDRLTSHWRPTHRTFRTSYGRFLVYSPHLFWA